MQLRVFLSLLICIAMLSACKKPQGFEYRDVKNIKVDQLGFDKTALTLDLVYYNPNGFGVNLRKVDCDVYINHTYLGKYQLDTMMHIDRKSEFVLPSRINVDMQTIYKNALSALFNSDILVEVKGTTRVGKAGIFVTVPFDYQVRQPLKLF